MYSADNDLDDLFIEIKNAVIGIGQIANFGIRRDIFKKLKTCPII